MKILITGKGGKSGSWAIRAAQMGGAIGARVQPHADSETCKKADIIVVVKRTPKDLMQNIIKSGTPWVFDIVDGWPQPCDWGPRDSTLWLQSTILTLNPDAMVYGTSRMMVDAQFPGLVLPHHAWTKYHPIKVREQVSVVGYEGSLAHLGHWFDAIQAACKRRGWQFQVNGDMTKADIGIALRGNGGYPAKFWKPGTKLANLHALGIPAICSPEAGYYEIASGKEEWIINHAEIDRAFDTLESHKTRLDINRNAPIFAPRLNKIAEQYKEWLRSCL